MGIADQISNFEANQKSLLHAIRDDDTELVTSLDRTVSSAFETILNSAPIDDAEFVVLMEFLLDQICPTEGQSTDQCRVKSRISELFLLALSERRT